MIQIIFEFSTQYGIFRDALYLPDDHTFSDTDIEAMKQERLNNWVAFVTLQDLQEPMDMQESVNGE